MPIAITCQCNRSYRVEDKFAGKQVKCPACQAVMHVPTAVPADDEYRLAADPSGPAKQMPATEMHAPSRATTSAKEATAPNTSAKPPSPSAGKVVSGHPEYFLTGYDRVFQVPKLFRVYQDGTELLFVYAGPFHSSMIANYQAEYAKAVKKGSVAGLSAGAGGAALGAGAAAAGVALDWLAGKANQRAAAKRMEELDAMNLEQLRQEVDSNKLSFRMSAENVDSAVIEPPSSGFFSTDENQDLLSGYLRFKHRPTGMWHMQLMTDGDVSHAVRGVRHVLASKEVTIKF
jgi:hypothetical protein